MCCIYISSAARGLCRSETQEFEQINTSYVISFICFLSHVWCMEAEAPVRGVDWRSGVVLPAGADGELGALFHRKPRTAVSALWLPTGLQ